MQLLIAPHGAACRPAASRTAAASPLPLPPPRPLRRPPPSSRLQQRPRLAGLPAAFSSSDSGDQPRAQQPGAWGAAAAGGGAARVDLAIEPGPINSRCIWAGVDVAAPAETVYGALTTYEQLQTFIPGLAENRVLERLPDGCRLLQAGKQELGLGVSFSARVCLRINEHPAGMPRRLLGRSPNARNGGDGGGGGGGGTWWPFGGRSASAAIPGYFGAGGLSSSGMSSGMSSASGASSSGSGSDSDEVGAWSERRWLRPRSPLGAAPSLDLSFELLEGDFAAFRGLWHVQRLPDGAPACRLSYTLFVRPQPWLPVQLVEPRIAGEIRANLAAVKAHTERLARSGG